MPSLLVNRVDLAYDEAGSGPPVVLVHAGLADRRMWDHQFAALSRHHSGDGVADDVPGRNHPLVLQSSPAGGNSSAPSAPAE